VTNYSNILELQFDQDEARFDRYEHDEGGAPIRSSLTPDQLAEAYANIDRAFKPHADMVARTNAILASPNQWRVRCMSRRYFAVEGSR
jgi:hypothetical protein